MKKILILLFCVALGNSLQAQNITVKGKVLSPDDPDGIPGVSVSVKGTNKGVITDANGNYSVDVSSKESVLIFSYIGFLSQEIKVGNKTTINVSLETDVTSLDEVVVVAYGEQKKNSVTGAISNIKNADLKRAAPSNLTAAIGGRVTGALVRLGDGNVGGADARYSAGVMDDASIFIRGKATMNSATPLILVDGIESTFSRINPEDVEQFSILKDAAATAVYGVRGANGVILITTKQGVIGKPKVSVNAQVRMHQPLKFPHPLGAYDYAVLYNEAIKNQTGKDGPYTEDDLKHWQLHDDPYGHPDVDWYDEVVKDHFLEEQYIANVTGGTEAVKYYVSGEYNHAGGPWNAPSYNENDYKRYNLRTNFDFKFTPTTNLSVKLNGRLESRGDVNYGESTGQRYYGSFWYGILTSSPIAAPIYNPNGTYAHGNAQKWNLRAILNEGGYRTRLSNGLDASLNLNQKLDFILRGLSARLMYGSIFSSGSRKVVNPEDPADLWDYNATTNTYTKFYTAPAYSIAIDNSNLPYAGRTQMEFALNYEKLIAKKHKVTAMAVAMQTKSTSSSDLPVAHRGVSGRVTYDFMSKYLAEINMGYNGSDRFSKGHRYALFPAVSVGWVLTEENFMKNIPILNFWKLRGTYGTAGNDKIGSSYSYLYLYSFNTTSGPYAYQNEVYNFGVTPAQQTGMVEGTLGNDRVSWEIAKKANIGTDIKLWKNKISLSADVFREKRDNILAVRQDVPAQTGLSSRLPAQNVGKVTNKGYEFEMSYHDKVGNFDYGLGGTYTFARSNIDYQAEAPQLYPWLYRTGHPIGQPFGYVWTGKFYDTGDLTNPDIPKPAGTVYPGDLMFEDLNGDGKIDGNDVKAIGYPSIPEIIYGFNINAGFKGFYLDIFWQGAEHISSRYNNELRYEFYNNNVLPIHLDRWVYDPSRGLDTRATAKYPSLIPGGSPQTQATSTFQVLNSAFLRLKTAEFGYYFPKKLINKLQMSDLKIFLSGSNLLTFDKIGYLDPEYNFDSTGNRGNSYPQTKFYAVGINITF